VEKTARPRDNKIKRGQNNKTKCIIDDGGGFVSWRTIKRFCGSIFVLG